MHSGRGWAAAGALALLAVTAAPAAGGTMQSGPESWVRTGGPLGGLGYDVRMSPGDPDRMLVTDAWAGVFRSEDGGATWVPSNEGITARTGPSGDGIPIFSLTIDPHDPAVVWAGTQNVRGIYRSDDGGRTWAEKVHGVEEAEGITFRGFAVDPRSSDIVYAAAEVASWVWAGREMPGREFDRTAGVVYKTEDRGETWRPVWRGDNLARYVWIDPGDPETVYLSTGIFDREAADSDPQARSPGGEGVVKSTDGGETWQPANDGLGNRYVGSLFLSPHDAGTLLAGTGNNQYFDGHDAYLSRDGAASWEPLGLQDNITAVEFTSDPAIAYAASIDGVWRTDDGGGRWDRVAGTDRGWGPPGVRAGFPIDMQADPRDPMRVFVNNYGGGNFLTTDGGYHWEAASRGYTGAQVRAIAVDPTSPGRVYAAARSGLFVSDDGGGSWRGLSYGNAAALEHHVIAVDPADPRHLLASTNWHRTLMASVEGGRYWPFVGPDLPESMAWECLVFAPADPAVAYAGAGAYRSAGGFSLDLPADGVYVSRDGGAGWSPINTGAAAGAQIADLAVHPEFVGFVYAASSTGGLLRTYDGGGDWHAVAGGLPEGAMALSVAFDPHDPDVQLAGYADRGLFRSTDGGDTWARAAAGLNPEAVVTDLVFDPATPGIVYAADQRSGVYRSGDAGASWEAVNAGLRTRAVNALALSADGRHLYAATEGEGVYRYDVAGSPPPAADPLWTMEEYPPPPGPHDPVTTQPPVTTVPPGEPAATPGSEAATETETTTVPPPGTFGRPPLEDADGGGPWVLVGAGTAGAAALLGAVLWLARRRRA